ncbi:MULTISPECIES: IclR family transcriptional regulator [unclassified Paraburkholderia]|uniref:IclR family transcriptional regulator n=1 Tax=unclassified Paraburkholderia TaxID=2615204 RepID=UPI0020B82F0E|nr:MULTISPECIES: IclR family transcriptional regulator [unclassified Paraburkholderia]MCP3720089.1 IclR family transcriptional regulator [Paraburkholderia sp. CNPSo 3281]MCX5540383.1 IclR family transcriptional regulator [Paraburkholderia sp. CNPSo 3076]
MQTPTSSVTESRATPSGGVRRRTSRPDAAAVHGEDGVHVPRAGEPLLPAPPDAESTDRQFAINLARGLQVLRAFTPAEPMLGNRELADRTGLPKATISRLTYTLTLLGYLNRSEKYQRYRLGAGVLTLGYPMLAAMQIRQIARPYMEKLARETRCSVNLGMRDRLNVVYVDTCRPGRDNNAQPDIGSTRPLLATSIGRALLIGEGAKEREAVLNRLRLDDPERYAADWPLWDADQAAFAARGYTLSRGDWVRDIHAIAVPVRQPPDDERIALNCTIVSRRLADDWIERTVAPLLLEAALRIERACGVTDASAAAGPR